VWVFVDYNNAGKMERLPMLPGATLTATSPGGKVIEETDNNKGVWVAGNARSAGSFSSTVKLLTAVKDVGGACVYGSNYPPVGKYIATDVITFTGTAPYTVALKGIPEPQTAGSYYIVPGAIASFTDKTGAPGIISAFYQPQGTGCTYTEPALVGTFANFDPSYSASTYVSLVDERDNKIYPVLKMGDRWMMARNLNYQKGLTWQTNSADPSTVTGSNTALIGSFWCPGGFSSTSPNSTRESCDVWGALYSWETAMMVDGKWSDDNRNSTTWGSDPSLSTNTSTGNTNNGGRGAKSHGICPPDWHVPTDMEWGDLLNAMEAGTKNHNSATGWIGEIAGTRAKSKCIVGDNGTSGNTYVNDTQANWYYSSGNLGIDFYGFRVLPTGNRAYDGSTFHGRGSYDSFWSSSANSSTDAWFRHFTYNNATVHRNNDYRRSTGLLVRCIRDN
jgi:uncharacterized protein (TIGR02145 family)